MNFLSKVLAENEPDFATMSFDQLYSYIKNFKGTIYGKIKILAVSDFFYVKLAKNDLLYMLKKSYKNHSPQEDEESHWNIRITEGQMYIGK